MHLYHDVVHSVTMSHEDGQEPERDRAGKSASDRDARHRRHRRRHRKERVLHTRISEDLADDIREIAEELRVPVSNIVRNVLEEAFSVVEAVSDNVGDIIEDVVDEAEAARDRIRTRQRRQRRPRTGARPVRTPAFEDEAEPVIGWQPLIPNRAQSCTECERQIPGSEQAFVGVTSRGMGSNWMCGACMASRG